jgi:hypothetical protein
MSKEKKDLENMINDIFKDEQAEAMESLDATKEVFEDLQRFLHFDDIWEAASDDISARTAVAAIIGTIALAVTDIGSPFIDFIMNVDEIEVDEDDSTDAP